MKERWSDPARARFYGGPTAFSSLCDSGPDEVIGVAYVNALLCSQFMAFEQLIGKSVVAGNRAVTFGVP